MPSGVICHTLRYGELFRGIAVTGAQLCILDAKILKRDGAAGVER